MDGLLILIQVLNKGDDAALVAELLLLFCALILKGNLKALV